MFEHYLKFAFRNFRSNKVIFGGSLLTLCLGALCISLLFSYVYNELTMNDNLTLKDDIYLSLIKPAPQSIPQVDDLKMMYGLNIKEFPSVKGISRIQGLPDHFVKLSYRNEVFKVNGLGIDSTFLKMFNYPLIQGDANTAFLEPHSLFLTEKLAETVFGNEDPMGKVIDVVTFQTVPYTVRGILKSPPSNSAMQFDYLMTTAKLKMMVDGGNALLMAKKFNKSAFEAKINELAKKSRNFRGGKISLLSLNEVYFNKGSFEDKSIFTRYGDKNSVNILLIILAVILIISALNYSNLQIINSNTQVKSSSIRRINGANFRHLSKQKLVELALLILMAAFIITIVYGLILPEFNKLTQVYLDPPLWTIFMLNVLVLLVISLIGLIYPMLITRRVALVNGLKNQGVLASQLKGRKAVIVVQYVLTFVLLISSVVVVKQLHMLLNKDLGFTSDRIISVNMLETTARSDWKTAPKKHKVIKNSLAKIPEIEKFTIGSSPIEPRKVDWKVISGEDDFTSLNLLSVSTNYDKVFGLEVLDGRFFEEKQDSSSVPKVVINEAAKKYWNIKDIQTTKIVGNKFGNEDPMEIIGVVKDFNYEHLSAKPKPLIMQYYESYSSEFNLKFVSGGEKTGLAKVESLFKSFNPNETISYSYLKDNVADLYQKEKQLSINYVLFTLIALLISAIGLFTLPCMIRNVG